MAFALSLSLCTLPLSAPLALAEETPVAEAGAVPDATASPDATVSTDGTNTTDTTDNTGTVDTTGAADTAGTAGDEGTALEPVLDENGEIVDPGTLPDSPFYWLTELIKKLQVILTTDPVAKTELLEDQALQNIAQAAAMVESGDTEEAQVAIEGYTQKLAEAQAFLEDLAATDSETAQKLELAMSQSHAQNIQTLGGLLDKLPPQASKKIALNIVRSMEKSIAKMEKKDQRELAKELRKATENIEESELTEEEQLALDALENSLDIDEENSEVPDTAATDMVLTTMSLMAETSSVESSKVITTEKNKANPNSNRQVKESGTQVETGLAEQEGLQEKNAGEVSGNEQQEQKQSEQKQLEPKEKKEQEQGNTGSKEKDQNFDKAQQKEAKER